MAFQTHLLNYFFIVFLVEVHTWSNICKWACIKKKWKSWNIKQIYLQRPPEHRHAVWNKTHISHNPIYTCFWGSVIYNMEKKKLRKYSINIPKEGSWYRQEASVTRLLQNLPDQILWAVGNSREISSVWRTWLPGRNNLRPGAMGWKRGSNKNKER